MPLIFAARTLDSASYEIDNSLRFNSSDNAILTYTPSGTSSDANKRKYTFSFWIKRAKISSEQGIINWGKQTGSDDFQLFFEADDTLRIYDYGNDFGGSASYNFHKITNRLFRDPSAWYHIFLRVDTTDGTAGDRVQLYINGVKETSFGTSVDASENYAGYVGSADACDIGISENNTGKSLGAYLSEFHYIDGTAKAHTDFGETNSNGVWIPKKYTGGSYSTNGFFLEFQQTGTGTNASGMGADTSGNTNHFAVTNLTATDQTTDTPTNNFCTLNPLYEQGNNAFSEGNCKVVLEAGDGSKGAAGGIAPANGKWYWEVKQGSATNSSIMIREASDREDYLSYYQGNFAGYTLNNGNQNITGNTNSTYGASYSSGDIIMVAMDMDNDKVYFGKNGSWNDGSGNADESSINDFVPLNGIDNGLGAFANANGSATATAEFNWGNPSFSISSGNADANGYGNFEYAVPSGFYALCTKNLAEFG